MLRCPYPSVRDGNRTCGALGTTFRPLAVSSRWWTRGVMGRLSDSKASYVRLVKGTWRKGLIRRNQNGKRVGLDGSFTFSSIHHPRRATDANLTHRVVLSEQLGKPLESRHPAVSRTQERGMVQGVKEAGESECRAVTVRTGPRERRYPTRKGADFRLVFTVAPLLNRLNPRRR